MTRSKPGIRAGAGSNDALGFEVGDRVTATTEALPGTIRFMGYTKFSEGFWIGIELDEPSFILSPPPPPSQMSSFPTIVFVCA